ncbi:MAG: hypothetical protein JWP66_1374, partial [Naasia sp.]|nr:hypothetical protein [Naasia sp.]
LPAGAFAPVDLAPVVFAPALFPAVVFAPAACAPGAFAPAGFAADAPVAGRAAEPRDPAVGLFVRPAVERGAPSPVGRERAAPATRGALDSLSPGVADPAPSGWAAGGAVPAGSWTDRASGGKAASSGTSVISSNLANSLSAFPAAGRRALAELPTLRGERVPTGNDLRPLAARTLPRKDCTPVDWVGYDGVTTCFRHVNVRR